MKIIQTGTPLALKRPQEIGFFICSYTITLNAQK